MKGSDKMVPSVAHLRGRVGEIVFTIVVSVGTVALVGEWLASTVVLT